MKQLKKLTRIQKIRLTQFMKANNYKYKVDDFGLVEANKDKFRVALKDDPNRQLTIPY